jgi:hypothetical protein
LAASRTGIVGSSPTTSISGKAWPPKIPLGKSVCRPCEIASASPIVSRPRVASEFTRAL